MNPVGIGPDGGSSGGFDWSSGNMGFGGGYGAGGGGGFNWLSPLGGTGYLPGSDPGTFGGFGQPRFGGGSNTGARVVGRGTLNIPGGGSVGGGSNQFFSGLPGLPNPYGSGSGGARTGLGIGSSSGSGGGGGNPYQVPSQSSNFSNATSPQYNQTIHGGQTISPQYPGLSGDFVNWLMSQVGQGVMPFNLSTPLPTGGSTQPGQLTAGENPMLQQLVSLLSGGASNISGGGFLQSLASGGAPGSTEALNTIATQGINALPEWQSMIASQGQNIAQNQANLREQFAGMGALAGSPFGTAMSNYEQQTTKDQNALLAQLTQQNILQGQIPAAEFMGGMQSGAASQLTGMGDQMSQYLQSLNQQAIQNQYGEFIRTSPQYNPVIGDIMGMSQTYPPTIQTGSGMGALGALLSGGGQLAGGIANLWPVLSKLFNSNSSSPSMNLGGGGTDLSFLSGLGF